MQKEENITQQTPQGTTKPKSSKLPLILTGAFCLVIGLAIGAFFITNPFSKTKNEPDSANANLEETDELIFNGKINSVKLRYCIGYNIATCDAIGFTIPDVSFYLEGSELEEVANTIKDLKAIHLKSPDELILMQDNHYFTDDFELIINDDLVLDLGYSYGQIYAPNIFNSVTAFRTPEGFYDKLLAIAEDYNRENIYKQIGGDSFTVIHEGKEYPITDEEQIRTISNYDYYTIRTGSLDSEASYIIKTDDGRTINIYSYGTPGRIDYADGSVEYIHIEYLEDYLDTIIYDESEE